MESSELSMIDWILILYIVLNCVIAPLVCSAFLSPLSAIETLTGSSNYKKWRQDMEFALGLMDLDMCILEDKPIASSDERLSDIKSRLEKWERSNRISLMIIQRSISETICGAFSSYDTVKEFLDAIGQKFKNLMKLRLLIF